MTNSSCSEFNVRPESNHLSLILDSSSRRRIFPPWTAMSSCSDSNLLRALRKIDPRWTATNCSAIQLSSQREFIQRVLLSFVFGRHEHRGQRSNIDFNSVLVQYRAQLLSDLISGVYRIALNISHHAHTERFSRM